MDLQIKSATHYMNVSKEIVAEILAADNILITSHKSPDGDSIGSSLGLYHFIERLNKKSVICHPDPAPDYLLWMDGVSDILTMSSHADLIQSHFSKADLIFCLDYNNTDRVGEMQVLLEEASGKKIVIDHHPDLQDFAFIKVSDTRSSSTSQLIAELIEQSGNISLLDETTATPLYLGILTDTGSFRFSSVQPETHHILGKLLSAGVKHHLIHETLNDTNSVSRLRLQGYAMSSKWEVLTNYSVSIISLTEEEHKRFDYKKGDTDGLPNLALSVKGMKAAILVSERDGYIRISFRSRGTENPVNILAVEHFEGGGHVNAAGGKSDLTMEQTLEKIKKLIPLYFNKED